MRANRLWLEIVGVGAAIALALALLIASLGAAAAAVSGQDEMGQAMPTAPGAKTYQGMVTCSRCRAKHSAAMSRTATDCTLACVRSGAKFALIDGENVYELDGDLTVLKIAAGQRANITGVANGNRIAVSSVAVI
jgi:hypothetical protein